MEPTFKPEPLPELVELGREPEPLPEDVELGREPKPLPELVEPVELGRDPVLEVVELGREPVPVAPELAPDASEWMSSEAAPRVLLFLINSCKALRTFVSTCTAS